MKHTEELTDKHTHGQTDRRTKKLMERWTDRQTMIVKVQNMEKDERKQI